MNKIELETFFENATLSLADSDFDCGLENVEVESATWYRDNVDPAFDIGGYATVETIDGHDKDDLIVMTIDNYREMLHNIRSLDDSDETEIKDRILATVETQLEKYLSNRLLLEVINGQLDAFKGKNTIAAVMGDIKSALNV